MDLVIDGLSWAALLAGGIFCIISAVGMWRMPDPYTRLHAANVTDTLGATLIIIGLMLQAGLTLITLKLGIILMLNFFISPAVAHALARAMLYRGVKPILSGEPKESA